MDAVEDLVRVGKAISDPTRIRILAALTVKPLCVCELTNLMAVGQPAVSRHLGILRDAGLVDDIRDGQWVNYRLRRPARTPFAESILNGLAASQIDDPEIEILRQRALVVDRLKLRLL